MLLGGLWKLGSQRRSKLSLPKCKGVERREGFLTNYADQKELDCVPAAASCPHGTKSLIFKMRYLLVLEPNS